MSYENSYGRDIAIAYGMHLIDAIPREIIDYCFSVSNIQPILDRIKPSFARFGQAESDAAFFAQPRGEGETTMRYNGACYMYVHEDAMHELGDCELWKKFCGRTRAIRTRRRWSWRCESQRWSLESRTGAGSSAIRRSSDWSCTCAQSSPTLGGRGATHRLGSSSALKNAVIVPSISLLRTASKGKEACLEGVERSRRGVSRRV